MSSINHSPAFIRKRKFLLVLPVLVLPFAIILFYLMGGGGKTASFAHEKQKGLNLQLPDAHFLRKKEPDKLALYEASNRDSDKLRLALRADPYRVDPPGPDHLLPEKAAAVRDVFEKTAVHFPQTDLAWKTDTTGGRQPGDLKGKQLLEKLNLLKELLNKPAQPDTAYRPGAVPQPVLAEKKISGLLRNMNSETVPDPEMAQLDKMLDKLIVIQHPGSVAEPKPTYSPGKKALPYSVGLYKNSDDPASFGGDETKDTIKSGEMNRFYELAENQPAKTEPDIAIKAVVPEGQILASGSTIKLLILNDVLISGHLIPKDQFIYGTCSMHNERMEIRFSSIRCASSILPVSLAAYDLDGLAGIFVPGSITRDAVKQSGDQAINGLGITALDPSIGAQAASAGIQAARTLLSHKVKLVKVTIRAGYEVLLKNENK